MNRARSVAELLFEAALTHQSTVAAIRIANEAFMVSSTIDRCPKTMMLRELVMNALEAAASAPSGSGRVEISSKPINGVPKLRIWNSGPGMTAAELYRICDLASSLHKDNGLDLNFGMGAKVASLPSNKYGMRYRSCHQGKVSEATLGQRNGVYGRLRSINARPGEMAEITDVTDACSHEGGYPLSGDWTEVVLFGNRADQNTIAAPYDGDPVVSPNWINEYLSSRFYRLHQNVSLTVDDGKIGTKTQLFKPYADRLERFDRVESVMAPGGVMVHYCYAATISPAASPLLPDGLPDFTGLAGIVHRSEIYGLMSGPGWISEAPNFGIPFGAMHCTLFIELPDDFGVRAEAYRQFLRFAAGDQRQVFLRDFASLVRSCIPTWLREIIASYGPAQPDYLSEVQSELQDLIADLGVVAEFRGVVTPRGATPPTPDALASPKLPTRRILERPPEIIGLRDVAMIDERQLQGRAARYYPTAHQVFVNLSYSSIERMAAQMREEFVAFAAQTDCERVARDLAEWSIIRRVGRAVVYSLGKKLSGWLPEEIVRAQSPEALSIVADDYLPLLPLMRQRMAELLGVVLPSADLDLRPSSRSEWGLRISGELIEAQQAARRALQTPGMNPAPILRRVSSIEARRGNYSAALEWAQRAVEANAQDASSQLQLSEMLAHLGDLAEAMNVAQVALELAPAPKSAFLRHLSRLESKRQRPEAALDWTRQALDADPEDARAHNQMSVLMEQLGDFNGAEAACRKAMELDPGNAAGNLRRLSGIALQRADLTAAFDWAQQAVALDPSDPDGHSHLARVLLLRGEADGAQAAAQRALELSSDNPLRFLLQLSGIELQRDRAEAAVDWALQATEIDPSSAVAQSQLAAGMLQQGDMGAAAEALRKAIALSHKPSVRMLRQLSSIEAQRRDLVSGVRLAQDAVAADPADPISHYHLSSLLLQQGEFDAAEAAARAAVALGGSQTATCLRQLSIIEARRKNTQAALEWASKAVKADPRDPHAHFQRSRVLMQHGDLDAAADCARAAVAAGQDQPARFLRHLSVVEMQRRNLDRAVEAARQAIEADASDAWTHGHLVGLLMQQGKLDEAERFALRALEISSGNDAQALSRLERIQWLRESEQAL